MKNKAYCPVCEVTFLTDKALHQGDTLICRVCGAKLTITGFKDGEYQVEKTLQSPLEEITDRTSTYADLRNFVFDEDKELVMEGLLEKKERYGDFYCPCRFDHTQIYVCPCEETRSGYVLKNGHCY